MTWPTRSRPGPTMPPTTRPATVLPPTIIAGINASVLGRPHRRFANWQHPLDRGGAVLYAHVHGIMYIDMAMWDASVRAHAVEERAVLWRGSTFRPWCSRWRC